ncbi:hypothetical protein [Methanonatronarchaeum sp. AMET6-2]|uniref:hypothetical protein n=1 Tax=Methanonatronarchaeum sp. AMET6-2 TaxID=2933293 RepID=UPI0011FF6A86|nr:hypothetical protein [Methanonatronarchaeum sp. AMET6-2]RZN62994.1 MAG: hypothetical protein EF811_01340 [Methanonatronarchaeia archaeon]UOY09977.1 hypothetical protein MU439_06875 [Methanonatronarchaeum sp. AMET6-2]
MNEDELKNRINKICKSNDGIRIMKKPENVEEEVLNAILSHKDKEKRELTDKEIEEQIKKITEKEKE